MKVKDAMHKGAQWVSPSTTVSELAQLMCEHDIGAVPIGENDRLVGMVTDRDIVCRCLAEGKDPKKTAARDVMTKGIVIARAEQDLNEAARTMEEKKIRRLPVIDTNKRMIGILSLGDLSHSAQNESSGTVLRAVSGHHH